MGRTTWESIPDKFKPLINRYNIVLSRDEKYRKTFNERYAQDDSYNAAICLSRFDEAVKHCAHLIHKKIIDSVFVIGGESVYKEALADPQFNTLWISQIPKTHDCDTFFTFNPAEWRRGAYAQYNKFEAAVYVRTPNG